MEESCSRSFEGGGIAAERDRSGWERAATTDVPLHWEVKRLTLLVLKERTTWARRKHVHAAAALFSLGFRRSERA